MNRQKKVKKGILFAVIIALAVVVIGSTYSRYTSTGNTNVKADIAKWHVTLNGTDISSESSNVNVTMSVAENDFVKADKFAPGVTGSFDIELDPTGSEVAMDYTFNVDSSVIADALEANSTSKFVVTGATYKIGSGEAQTATIDQNGIITVNETLAQVENGNKVLVTVNVLWDNDSDAQSVSDTKEGVASSVAGVNGKTVTFPVVVTAKQHI